jgi:hypothetical protein
LANDAEQADTSFAIATSSSTVDDGSGARLLCSGLRRGTVSVHVSPALLNGQAQLPEDLDPEFERLAWQLSEDVVLSNDEAVLFRHFTDRCAKWLDLFDPQGTFSTYAIRLALRNMGLMKAILALSAKHRAKGGCRLQNGQPNGQQHENQDDVDGSVHEHDEQIRYYYETLHFVREGLKYPSYSHSEELLATALIISAYEMLDEADGSGNWQRHLKGIFWIQRSQDVDGGCGGLRQAVWWAWLRQDIWAAFREKRPCQSFWRPAKSVHELSQHELADRVIYLLSQAVNYSAQARDLEKSSQPDSLLSVRLSKRKADLLSDLDRWKACLGDEYSVLPVPSSPADIFKPLWVHPPQFGAALQAYSLALILITLYSPGQRGFGGYLKMQRTLSEAVNTICGIAMELDEEGCQVLSAQCLYGAGLCLQDQEKRAKVMDMMELCEARVGWAPMAIWREELRREWAAVDMGEF